MTNNERRRHIDRLNAQIADLTLQRNAELRKLVSAALKNLNPSRVIEVKDAVSGETWCPGLGNEVGYCVYDHATDAEHRHCLFCSPRTAHLRRAA